MKSQILLDRIAAEENVIVSDEELDREIEIAALQSGEPVATVRSVTEPIVSIRCPYPSPASPLQLLLPAAICLAAQC